MLIQNIKAIIGISLLIMLVSCDGLFDGRLEEDPRSVAAEQFYNTVEEVETAVNAIYVPLRSFRAEQIAVLDAHTDWGYGRGSRADYNDFSGFNSGNINIAGNRWQSFYEAIRNANLVILNAPDGNLQQSELDLMLAEAKFLRALSYFDLVRNWGGVPLRTENNTNETDVPRSEVGEVYGLILGDLEYAEANLPENPRDIGRPTVWAAKTLLADVYMHLERADEAQTKVEQVMESNAYELVPISSKEDLQWDLFGPEVTTTSEEVFYFKYTRQPGQGNWINFVLNHPATELFNFGGAYAHYGDAANPFFVEWDDDDIRKELWDQIDFGLGPTTLVSSKYIDPSAVGTSGAGNDLPIYRYAEVLLIYSEASARVAGGPTLDGMEALNKVRRRAYGYDPVATSDIDYDVNDYDLDSFIDLVIQERGYEFVFEGKRWLDLKRTGKAQEMVMRNKGISIADRHYLWPIPNSEFDFNGAMDDASDQNPGY